jgi:hypothetical protein
MDFLDMDAPVLLFGVGWKNTDGTWQAAHRCHLNDISVRILQAAAARGFYHSCRDLHTKYIARKHGICNFQVTGCPVLFHEDGVPASAAIPSSSPNIVFSPGVSYLRDDNGIELLSFLVRELKSKWPDSRITAAFHHSIERRKLVSVYGVNSPHVACFHKTRELLSVLSGLDIHIEDVSGSLEKMRALYDNADGHIGYRVHGHVYMISSGKPSVLLAEDNRALGFKDLIGGAVFDVSTRPAPPRGIREYLKMHIPGRSCRSNIRGVMDVIDFAVRALGDELAGDTSLVELSLSSIRTLEKQMVDYIKMLP